MKINLLSILILIVIVAGCNKVRKYQINIVNETGYEIQDIELTGTTDYNYAIEKDGETGIREIEWEGPRSYLDGDHCFYYRVNSFSDSNTVYVDSALCAGCIVVRDLSEKEVNTLTLHTQDPGQSDCGPYLFKIDY